MNLESVYIKKSKT